MRTLVDWDKVTTTAGAVTGIAAAVAGIAAAAIAVMDLVKKAKEKP